MLQRPSRTMWIAAIIVSVICVGALAYAFIAERDTKPEAPMTTSFRAGSDNGSGFGIGLGVGIGLGIVIGSLIALRKR